MASERYILKHFYYGQFVKDGKPVGDLRLLAQTSGISKAAIAETLQIATIPPIKGQGAWAVVRGKQDVPFVLVESAVGAAGQTVLHFILLPSELLRALGGNLRCFKPLFDTTPPAYERVGNTLIPLTLEEVQPPSEAQEVDDILDFMMDTNNRMNVMETLLGAVVQGVPVVILNAPDNPDQRLTFITGLLSLLPPSVRFAVTFATHTVASTKANVQIRFVADDGTLPENAVIYDWQGGKLSGADVQESYSRFIVSQLRLDAELVIQQTRQLTNVASWRVKRGDRLAEALAYASQRMSIDDAVRNNQPVEADEVARVLANDPTLSDAMRLAYARHLLSFSVALGELEHAEPLGMLLPHNTELAVATQTSLETAIEKGAGGDVYDLVSKWLADPLGPKGQRWVDMSHKAARTYFQDMVNVGDTAEIMLFMNDVDAAGVSVGASKLMPQLVQMSLPAATKDPKLARRVFVYAARQLPIEDFEKLLTNRAFLKQQPEAIQHYVAATQQRKPVTRDGLLLGAAKAVKPSRRLVLVRLAELALRTRHPELIDDGTLRQLAQVGLTDWGKAYRGVLLDVVSAHQDNDMLRQMSASGRRQLLGILLAVRAYRELAREMIRHSRVLYPAEKQTEYAKMLQVMFAETPIRDEHIAEALEGLADNGIRSLPLAMAFIGVLEGREKPSEMTDAIAGDVTDQIENERSMVTVIPIEAMRTLLLYHMRRQNIDDTLRVMRLFAWVAARYGKRSAKIMVQIYRRLDWHQAVENARLEMLRRYIRAILLDEAPEVVAMLGQALGKPVQKQLEAAYAVRLVMGDRDIESYAQMLHHMAAFLQDTATAYQSGRNVPSQKGLISDLASLPGGLNRDDKDAIADDVIGVGRALCYLGEQHQRVRNHSADKRITDLLQGEADPKSAVEIMRVMGGYLSSGKRTVLKLTEQAHPHPLPSRSGQSLLEEVQQTCYLLQSMTQVSGQADAAAVTQAMAGIWEELSPNRQRELLGDLARDLQRTADLIPLIAGQGNLRALEDTGVGRRLEENRAKPSNAIEFYRFLAGYYRA